MKKAKKKPIEPELEWEEADPPYADNLGIDWTWQGWLGLGVAVFLFLAVVAISNC